MKIIFKALGGSHAYGLNTPASDLDYRGVFVNTEINKLIGLDRFEHQDLRVGEQDEFYFELRHFLCSLRKTNTMVIELLFSDSECFIETGPEWESIRESRFDLLDSEKLYRSLKGYIFGETKLVTGERTGTLGGKRKEMLNKYGYSPKNAVQAMRLCWAGSYFFMHGEFPVRIDKFDPIFGRSLLRIKTHPQSYNVLRIVELIKEWEAHLDKAFNERTKNYKFNDDKANKLCLEIYFPLIKDLYEKESPKILDDFIDL